ncbi:RES domain-containing protein [Mucilaginibacter sp. X4EP1]|uniref:RES domain-containing protein n=1 Tax=Mucilaginibacter sp. X4EP1 TaxID=2723092 RepID=UPI0021695CE2|nr:RES domain-containing protein [Mucilaginibacter sp. X4EP1]MCS3815458.1 hypothetical protein [Mucilaginibacter sp. X4EP1]
MKVETKFPIKIIEWHHEPAKKFIGKNNQDIFYELGFSKTDILTNCFQFSVRVNMQYRNMSNGIVFNARTESNFSIGYQNNGPSVEFLFGLLDIATIDFAKIFDKRVKQTNLVGQKVTRQKIKDWTENLQKEIDHWNAPAKKFKESGAERLSKFKNLPNIPVHKMYTENSEGTTEQIIVFKLCALQAISEEERKIFEELEEFYDELNTELLLLDYESFTIKDLSDFKKYIQYAFNSHVLMSSQLTVVRNLYRVVINESVSKRNETITAIKYLTYPSLEIVKNIGKYNRASTSNTTLLYLTESVDTALKEIHPPLNKLVTIGVWTPKNKRTFTHYPITHHDRAIEVNEQTAAGYNATQQLSNIYDPALVRYMNKYFKLLSREYSKLVSNDKQYALSALLSEYILSPKDVGANYNYDCIVYPSVGNNYITRNLAVNPDVADSQLKLIKIIEFEITDADYSLTPNGDWENISIAQVKNRRETENIMPDGTIIW